ncbi:MAG: hypothetical protein FJ030_01430 [Chloroflexi bacterium]|nr:hypothetical protein [Chloroflexota bacterium]
MTQRPLKIVGGVLLGLTILLYLGYFLIYLRYTAALLQFPFDYDQGEGFELNDSVLFARGEWPYRSNEVYPFYASNYPPLYHLFLAPFVWVFGPAYWYGRLFSFLSTLVAAGAIAFAVHRAARDKPISLVSGLAFLASNYVYHIGPLFRQHISMVMFETLAVVILAPLARADTPAERKRLALALLCLLAAGYTKQLAYATVAVSLLFIIGRGVKRGLIVAVGFAAVAASIFGSINLATGGQWWINIILANINEFIPGQMEGLYRQWFELHAALIVLSILFVVFAFATARRAGDGSNVLYALWFVAAAANGALAGKWGAGESYFMTSIAAMCICAGMMLAEWRRDAVRRGPLYQWGAAILIPYLLISQAGRLVHMPTQGRLFEPLARWLNLPTDSPYYDSQGYTQLGRPPNAIDIEQGYKILSYTRAADGPVMTEEASFSLLAGKEQVGNPTQLLNLAKNSMLDSSAMVKMIDERAFDLIVLKAEFYPRPVLIAIGQNYESVETIIMNGFNYRVLKPKAEGNDAP